MDRITRRTGLTIAAAGAVSAAAAAAALAAPTAGLWTSGGEGGGSFTVKAGTIGPAGAKPNRFITAPSNFKCNTSNLIVKSSKIAISGGRFSYDGPAYVDRFRAPSRLGHLVWTGRFTSASKVKGTYRFTSKVTPKITTAGLKFAKKSCDSGKHTWSGHPGYGVGVG
jgi:hypothetical protein